MVKESVTIVDSKGDYTPEIPLANESANVKAKTENKQIEEQYQVAALGEEDVLMTSSLLRLLPQSDTLSFDNIESRVTSVSLKDKKMAGASLTTVLSQAL
jgi:hypothetical protein